ncbi:MAG: carboxypeptidase regulatory-like domain-containing protein [Bryobacteraceae bacterium]
MTRPLKISLGLTAILAVAAGIGIYLIRTGKIRFSRVTPVALEGAVLRQDSDPRKQVPIEDAVVSVTGGMSYAETKSNASGLFRVTLRPGIKPGQTVNLRFSHPDYKPIEITEYPQGQIVIARLQPEATPAVEKPNRPDVKIKNDVRVRYSVKVQNTMTVGVLVKPFEVENRANVPCQGRQPCSPDGMWKASIGSTTLDAEEGNELQNVRVSCIAGPCSFTQIEPAVLSGNSRYVKVSARDWSGTATFLVEAEVIHSQVADMIRYAYPVIFGPAMNFTLPPGAEGPSIEADVNGQEIVFPLGPELILSWAACSVEMSASKTRIYRCELKPGYDFVPAGGQTSTQ